jgi:predicted amidophosphoribosyltransferase
MECYSCGYKLPADAERCSRCGQRFKPRTVSQSEPAKPSLLDRLKSKLGKKDEDDSASV